MFGVSNGFCLGFDRWFGYDVAIMGARARGFPFQCCHLSVSVLTLGFSMLALECLSAGASAFQWWHQIFSVLALECLSVWHFGTGVSQGLAQEGRTILGL